MKPLNRKKKNFSTYLFFALLFLLMPPVHAQSIGEKATFTQHGEMDKLPLIQFWTAKNRGESIELSISGKSVIIQGANGSWIDDEIITYTLTDQHVKIYAKEITSFTCDLNEITSIDVSQATNLTTLSALYNNLTSIDLSQNKNLTGVYLSGNSLKRIDLKENSNLLNLYIGSNSLEDLELTHNPLIETLFCNDNQLGHLSLEDNENIEFLDCSDNLLNALDVRKNLHITDLFCSHNMINRLDLTMLKDLEYLNCSQNKLEALDLSENRKIEHIQIQSNKIKAEGAESLVKSLNRRGEKKGIIVLVDSKDPQEGNSFTKEEIQSVQAKNWETYDSNGSYDKKDWIAYSGSTNSISVESGDQQVFIYKEEDKLVLRCEVPSKCVVITLDGRIIYNGTINGEKRIDSHNAMVLILIQEGADKKIYPSV